MISQSDGLNQPNTKPETYRNYEKCYTKRVYDQLVFQKPADFITRCIIETMDGDN